MLCIEFPVGFGVVEKRSWQEVKGEQDIAVATGLVAVFRSTLLLVQDVMSWYGSHCVVGIAARHDILSTPKPLNLKPLTPSPLNPKPPNPKPETPNTNP